MAARKEMDGERLQREMMERRRDEAADESVEEEAEQICFTAQGKHCEEKTQEATLRCSCSLSTSVNQQHINFEMLL